jgi:intracellular sulfur oxidation DsrE/DsrF family protein
MIRRTFLKALAGASVSLLLTAGIGATALAAEPIKVVYHLTDGIEQASRAMGNIRNHLRADPSVKIVVVTNGEGIRFLLAGAQEHNGKPFDAAVTALVAQGVEFRVCENTLAAHNVPRSSLLPEAKLVPSGVAEVARLQAREGYVYLRP